MSDEEKKLYLLYFQTPTVFGVPMTWVNVVLYPILYSF